MSSKLTFDYAGINDFGCCPRISSARISADPAKYRRRTAYDTDPTNPGLYFGPYRITEVAPGSHVVLEPNPTWWGEKPLFQAHHRAQRSRTPRRSRPICCPAPSTTSPASSASRLDQALAFEKRHGDRFNIIYKPGLIYEHIDLNLDNPILAGQARAPGADLCARSRGAQQAAVRGPAAGGELLRQPARLDGRRRHAALQIRPGKRAAALLDEAGWKHVRRRRAPQRRRRAAVASS